MRQQQHKIIDFNTRKIEINVSEKRKRTYFGFIRNALRMKSIAADETPPNNLSGNVKAHWEMLRKVSCLVSPPKGEKPDSNT